MADMIKFLRGSVANLPQTATAGALYFTKDEGIYMGMEDGSYHRYGEFIVVSDVDSLPASGAHDTCMYYCSQENILAKYDATKGSWTQINKQPTAEEMKTLLGLGSLAYKSEVAEGDLSTELAEKVNAAAEGNHAHSNKTVLDGITAEKVAAWDASEKNAKDHADGLNTAMNTRVEALEAIDHSHTFVEDELNKIVDGDVAKWNAAAEKAHTHSFNETELNKIVDGDVAKWNGVAADHLTSADKTTLENAIKEAKKAGTDANTNIETYKVSNDARVLAVEEDVAEIVDGTNGILAQAKSYSDGKLATARTEISAEIDADVKVVADDLAGYKTSNDAALAGVKATAEAAAVKTEVETALAGKVDKVEGKSLISDAEITRLAGVTNYDDTQVKADIAKKADAETMTTELGKKVDKVDGKSLVDNAEITKLAGVSEGANKVEASTNGKIKIDGVDTTVYVHPEKHTVSEISDFDASVKAYDYATKTEAKGYADAKDEAIAAALKAGTDAQGDVDALETYVGTFTASEGVDTVVKYIDAKTANIASDERVNGIDGRLTQAEKDIDALETESAKHAIKAEVEGALALKADKSVVDAMYTNAQIDGFIAEAKKYADDNDADTKYGIVYDSDNKKIKLVEGGTAVEIDASAFIKDGMISDVTIDENDDLIITFNTDAGKENIVLPLDQLVDIYTGVEGDRVKVTVNADKSISADLVAGSISKDYLDAGVKASLALADSALQSHQDISHLAVKTQVATDIENAVKVETERATGAENDLANRIKDLEDNKAGYATTGELATAIENAKTDASNQDAVVLAEAQAYADQAEADAVAAAEGKVQELARTVYTQTQIDNLLSWGSF